MSKRRPYAVAVYKEGRRQVYGFGTHLDASRFRVREIQQGHKVSPVIHLGGRRG